ncbi:MAG: glycosyltransferase [Bacteroidales bacterium]|nr:glycosyltransferase [Bacteroidales bacterium]
MKESVLFFYGYFVFFYSMALLLSYAVLIWLAYISLTRSYNTMMDPYVRRIIRRSPYTPGVSIVAPAYNEERTIVDNVNSLLLQDYPLFEVVIVNDGSTDKTLDKLIENFDLVEVPYQYNERIPAKPFRGLYRSTNPKYERLTVVDKENGGTKADPVNAGLNVAVYPYFINTDVDCILAPDAIFKCMRPMLEMKDVIAVSGVMTMSNGCTVEDGRIVKNRVPNTPAPLFQTLEYMRSFLIGKMGWSAINAMPNVSGGYGLFDRDVAIAAGGYSSDSLAEDMDMLIRMIGYCCDFKRPYRVVQIPDTCCWTEGPPNLSVLYRQRTRWGHGLMQTYGKYYRMMFKRKYRQLGLITLPYIFFFELLAPFIEAVGLVTFIYLALTGAVNWGTALVIFLVVYAFCLVLSLVVVFYDYIHSRSYRGFFAYFKLIVAALLEPFFYHPFIVFFSLRGYFRFFMRQRVVWGEMTRKGFSNKNNKDDDKDEDAAPATDDGNAYVYNTASAADNQ